ncbi:MAG: hypothetical protein U0R26_05650 [Solirubrobacterales bacterium]
MSERHPRTEPVAGGSLGKIAGPAVFNRSLKLARAPLDVALAEEIRRENAKRDKSARRSSAASSSSSPERPA